MHKAASGAHLDTIVYLCDAGALVDASSELGMTPLLLAAQKGNPDTCRLLLGSGASVDAKDSTFGWTGLHFATSESHESTMACLIEGGANPRAKDEGGRSAVYCAKHPSIKVLLARLSAEFENSRHAPFGR